MADDRFLQHAYDLARDQHPHPNPRVGAVVVSASGNVIGEGAHQAAGGSHAEVVALEGIDARGSTVYVSLEPCSHHGRTPPCVDRLNEAGVAKVVVGALDPDPRVSGSGVAKLREAGVEVHVVDDPAAESLDPGYFHHRRTGQPLITLKYAMTADGSVAAADGSSQWITGPESRDDVHRLRASSDAVVVGAGTIRTDDPSLDVRLEGYDGRQPRPVIVAGSSDLPTESLIWDREPLVFTTRDLVVPSGEVVMVSGDDYPDPVDVCATLADRGMYDVLLEGGPTLSGVWWRAGVVSKAAVYVGARFGGGRGMSPLNGAFETIDQAVEVSVVGVTRLGDDIRIDYARI